jgi:DNA-binding transcriptional ArsR family regulator
MKQITEINDSRLVKALAHPLRVQILRVLQGRVASPSELAEELDARLGNVSYHMRVLERLEVIELVKTKPRRGAVEHYFRARGKLRITDKAWAQVPEIVKDAMVAATLEQITRYVHTAASIGGFEDQHAHLTRHALVLDKQGFTELAGAMRELIDQALEIEAASAVRAKKGDHAEDEINTGLVMMLFEAAPPSVGIPSQEAASGTRKRTRTHARAQRG